MNLSSIYQIFHGNLLAQEQTLVALRTQALHSGAPAWEPFLFQHPLPHVSKARCGAGALLSAQFDSSEGAWVTWAGGHEPKFYLPNLSRQSARPKANPGSASNASVTLWGPRKEAPFFFLCAALADYFSVAAVGGGVTCHNGKTCYFPWQGARHEARCLPEGALRV